MVTPIIVFHYFTVDCLVWAPIVACVAGFAVVQPHWSVVNNFDVVYGADFCADSAAFAFCVVALEASVGCGYELAKGRMLFCV